MPLKKCQDAKSCNKLGNRSMLSHRRNMDSCHQKAIVAVFDLHEFADRVSKSMNHPLKKGVLIPVSRAVVVRGCQQDYTDYTKTCNLMSQGTGRVKRTHGWQWASVSVCKNFKCGGVPSGIPSLPSLESEASHSEIKSCGQGDAHDAWRFNLFQQDKGGQDINL